MSLRFQALVDFEDPKTGSVYCRGLSYTVRDGNTALAEKVQKWTDEGKVVAATPEARVAGKGDIL